MATLETLHEICGAGVTHKKEPTRSELEHFVKLLEQQERYTYETILRDAVAAPNTQPLQALTQMMLQALGALSARQKITEAAISNNIDHMKLGSDLEVAARLLASSEKFLYETLRISAQNLQSHPNFYDLEKPDAHQTFCWSGPSKLTQIQLPIDRSKDRTVTVNIAQFLAGKSGFEGLSVRVDSQDVKTSLRRKSGQYRLQFRLPASSPNSESETEIDIELKSIASPKALELSDDIRPLGMAVSSISVA